MPVRPASLILTCLNVAKREALAERSIGHLSPEARRYRERSTVERVNGWLKEEFGGR